MLRAYFSLTPPAGEPRSVVFGHREALQKIDILEKKGVYLIHDTDGFYALRGECTHLGCRVHWSPSRNRFECPCHGSRYDRNGRVLTGPARTPLIRVLLKLSPKGEIIADLSTKVPPAFRLPAG